LFWSVINSNHFIKPLNVSNNYMKNFLKFGLLLILTFQSCFIFAQKFEKKYFVKTAWFVNNKDSIFYKSDTLKLIKHVNLGPEWSGKEYSENEMEYFGHGDFVEIKFERHSNLHFNWRVGNSHFIIPTLPWKWKYKKDDQTIEIRDDKDILILKCQPIFEKQIEITSRYDKNIMKTVELTVVRIK
ncbi:hypothetical protein, partial [uncultured Flavobacterium sp.]|uniref:hypothetical protein n=1 Tax=uncultured Flavobacterium sp. TaxID=165435 RepID=UPI0030EED4F4